MRFPELRRFHIWAIDEYEYDDLREYLDELVNQISASGLCPNIESIAMSSDSRRFEFLFSDGLVRELPADDQFEHEWLEWPLIERNVGISL